MVFESGSPICIGCGFKVPCGEPQGHASLNQNGICRTPYEHDENVSRFIDISRFINGGAIEVVQTFYWLLVKFCNSIIVVFRILLKINKTVIPYTRVLQ